MAQVGTNLLSHEKAQKKLATDFADFLNLGEKLF
jgi:hypothetical protein